ncbi:DUF4423 domain-containing protein [Bacteriovorax sp. DB6_IX]|uniref:DUF4423 domain-containing protein n=1 Tax=Bacteriovorax sp. DB6_IX TaxID=1353530 RepID=UPI00038A3DB4|nr:DUF4423 domain-containing protein [Bacteriovorax sp. DB6_IX]EQC52198.1 DNA-binding helix-turn-helix protein [Bacteriovorax sp. DB6_IX]
MDYKKIASEIIRAMRAELSQEQLNRKLNSSSNQVHRWEKGHTRVEWNDFLNISKALKLDINKLFYSYYRYENVTNSIHNFLNYLFAGQSIAKVSKKVNISESKLRRIMNSETSPTLDSILQILFSFDQMEAFALIHELTDGKPIPSLAEEKERSDLIVKSYHENPALGLILICLELPEYKSLSGHRDSWLSEITGIPIKEVNELLKLSEEVGLLIKDNGKYHAGKFKLSDRGDAQAMRRVRHYWTALALKKQERKSAHDAFGSIVFTTSKEAKEKIIARYLSFFDDFKQIVEEDQSPPELPFVMNFQLFTPGHYED